MRLLCLFAAFLLAPASSAETLRHALMTNGDPQNIFSDSELDGNVNAAAAVKGDQGLVVYMRLDNSNLFTGNPQLVEFDRNSTTIHRSEVAPPNGSFCCGSPEEVTFVDDFAIVSFHINPSAEVMLVLGKDLKVVRTLYGFDLHQVGPAQVVFIENMIHFAAEHPERLRFADLQTGRTQELYPIRGDVLRAQFAELHRRHMPPENTCQQNNDPCNPLIFAETIEFLSTEPTGAFSFRVVRLAAHPWVTKDAIVDLPFQETTYNLRHTQDGWSYCSTEISAAKLITPVKRAVPDKAQPNCSPNLPVVADQDAAQASPFSGDEQKVK